MALGGSNVSYDNGSWGGTLEGNAVEQALGGAGMNTGGFEVTDMSYNASEGWTGAFSNEFGTVNQDGQYSATVIPDDGDESTTWPAVQETAGNVKTTISDVWTSIFGGEKPADGQQEVVENTGEAAQQPAAPSDNEQPTERQMPPEKKRPEGGEVFTEANTFSSRWSPRAEQVLAAIAGPRQLTQNTRLTFPNGGAIERLAYNDGLRIMLPDGSRIQLAGTRDFRRLTEAQPLSSLRLADSSQEWLDTAVGEYYSKFVGQGGVPTCAEADDSDCTANARGSGRFSFDREEEPPKSGKEQSLRTGDPGHRRSASYEREERGLHCEATTMFHQWKALGLAGC